MSQASTNSVVEMVGDRLPVGWTEDTDAEPRSLDGDPPLEIWIQR